MIKLIHYNFVTTYKKINNNVVSSILPIWNFLQPILKYFQSICFLEFQNLSLI